ncbi:MAG: beta-glucosidase [Oscillospiraceae bacterium]|nr:beta-glucosidase [Oscillospiraceae bacterium]
MSFRKDFMWGAAAAAYQIEGGYRDDGKGLNVWDVFTNSQTAKKTPFIKFNENGNEACDHYHRYKEDVKLMKEAGIKYYRLSVSWARVMPEGTGRVNEAGLKFYSDLIDELIANGITPLVTLFHWEYPYELYKRGGWLNPESSEWFAEYAKVVVDALSDRVIFWMTVNEPQVFIGLGHFMGVHAPFLKMHSCDLLQMTHNVLLAHGKAVKVIRENAKTAPKVGFAYSTPCNTPVDDTPEAIEEARRKSFDMDSNNYLFSNTLWADPVFFGKYDEKLYELFGDEMPEIKPGDMEIISQPVDFYGLNIYESRAEFAVSGHRENSYQGIGRTTFDWPVTPETMYWSPKFLYERYGLPVLITENGMANTDWVQLDGRVHDTQRIDFTHRYLRELKRAAENGVDILGYMHWSVMDNFEWAEGYSKRFGLIYVDYRTQERTLKDSAFWYKEVIETNGENL